MFHKNLLIALILLSILPFLLLLNKVNFSLFATDSSSFWMDLAGVIANMTGFMGTILFAWEFIFGIRFISVLFSDDTVWYNKLHSWIGKYGTILVFIHPLLEMYVYLESWFWLINPIFSTPTEVQINFGRVAFILFVLIYFSSALLRGKLKYRPWLYLHYLSYPLMFFTFLHALQIGTYLNEFLVIKAMWFTLMALYFILLIARLVLASAIFLPKYVLVGKVVQAKDMLYLAFKPTSKKLIPKVGQYVYLQLDNFGEAHPFSVMEYDQKSGILVFGVKIVGNFTKKLIKLEKNSQVYIDGPYGVFTREGQNARPKVIIAGGIGVTPFVELVKQYKSPSTIFIHSNRVLEEVVARPLLKKHLELSYIDFISHGKTNEINVINERLNTAYLSEIVGIENLDKYNYFICGSQRFNEGIKEMLKSLNISQRQVFIEDFNF